MVDSHRYRDPVPQYGDSAGESIAGARLFFFESGTSTPLDTFSDEALTVANSNPVVCDADGRVPNTFLSAVDYKVILKEADEDVTIWERDPVNTVFITATQVLYTFPATGAEARTVSNRLAEKMSAKDFGVTGDGVTDDTAAIILLAAAVTDNVEVTFPPGTYLISRLGFSDFTSVFGNVVFDISDKDNLTIQCVGATFKCVNHDIATYGGLRMFNFANCHGLTMRGENSSTFDMTFTGSKDSASFYPFCGGITLIDASSADGQDYLDLNGDIHISGFAFKLFHPFGAYVVTTNPHLGDSNNGYKIFSIFGSGATDGDTYAEQSRKFTARDITFKEGHNGYGVWTWAYNTILMDHIVAEDWVNKKSNPSGVIQGGATPCIRNHQFSCSGLTIVNCNLRAKPSSERTVSGFEGHAKLIGLQQNLTDMDLSHGKTIIADNIFIIGNGDQANLLKDEVIDFHQYGSLIIISNQIGGHEGDTVNARGSSGITYQDELNGKAVISIINNTFGYGLDYNQNIVLANGNDDTEYKRRIKSLTVTGNISLGRSQYFLDMRGDTAFTYAGFRQVIITDNIINGTFDVLFDKNSTNSRAIRLAGSEADDIVKVTGTQFVDINRAFIDSSELNTDINLTVADSTFVGVTTEVLGSTALMTNRDVTWNTGVIAGLTADTGSAQGGTPLRFGVNHVGTCANAGDSVTLPDARGGERVVIMNNGANACDVFPASGNNLGAGTNNAISVAAGATVQYIAYNTANWEAV